MRKMVLVAAALAGVTAASPAFAVVDGPVFYGYQHSMQSTGSSELGMPPFRESPRDACAAYVRWPDDVCQLRARGAFRR